MHSWFVCALMAIGLVAAIVIAIVLICWGLFTIADHHDEIDEWIDNHIVWIVGALLVILITVITIFFHNGGFN